MMKLDAEAPVRKYDFNHEENPGEGLEFDAIEDCIKSFGMSKSLVSFRRHHAKPRGGNFHNLIPYLPGFSPYAG